MIISYPLFFLRLLLIWLSFAVAIYTALYVSGSNALPLYGAALVLFAGTLWWFDKKDAYFKSMYNAHWATKEEIAGMFVKQFTGREVFLGYAYNQPIVLRAGLAGKKELGHVLIVGPSRAGKGLNATANLLNWTGSTVVVDIKGEFYQNTSGYRQQVMGQDVYVLNPSSGAQTSRFDPFLERDTDEQLLASATAILNPDADGSNSAFARRAAFALFAMMKTAKLLNEPVMPFIRDCLSLGCKECMALLDRATDDKGVKRNLTFFLGTSPALYDWDGFAGDKFLNNSWMNLISKLMYMLSDGVIDMTLQSDFKATDLLKKPTSLYMVFRESDLKYTVHAFSSVLLSIIESIIKYYDLHPDEPTTPILFIFDEAGRITVPELPELTSTVAGRGMVCMIYVQALAQLETTYQSTGSDTIKANTHTKIYFAPKDAETAKYISDNGGKYMMETQTHGTGGENETDSTGLMARELITVDQTLQLGLGQTIIHSNEFPYIAGYRMEPFTLPQFKKAQTLPPAKVVKRDVEKPKTSASAQRTPPPPVAGQVEPGSDAPGAPAGEAPKPDDQPGGATIPFTPPLNEDTRKKLKGLEQPAAALNLEDDSGNEMPKPLPMDTEDVPEADVQAFFLNINRLQDEE